MPPLSKDAEIDLLTDAFTRFSDPSGWQPFLSKIDAYLNCKSFTVEYLEDGSASGRFSDQEEARNLSEVLEAAETGHGIPAHTYLLRHANPGHFYCVSDGQLTDLGHDPPADTGLIRPPAQPDTVARSIGFVSVFRPQSHATIFFGIFPGDEQDSAVMPPAALSNFRKVSLIVDLKLKALEGLRSTTDDANAHKAMAAICGSPSVLINSHRQVLAECPPGLDALASLDAAICKNGKLLLKNRAMESCFHELLSEAKHSVQQSVSAGSSIFLAPEPVEQSQQELYLRDANGSLHRITMVRLDHKSAGKPAWIVIRVLYPAAVPEAVETILLQEFGLSLSEAHLARLLAVTGSVPNTTELLNITRNTMKTHLRRIFDKTGTRTQLELIQLVYQLTGLV